MVVTEPDELTSAVIAYPRRGRDGLPARRCLGRLVRRGPLRARADVRPASAPEADRRWGRRVVLAGGRVLHSDSRGRRSRGTWRSHRSCGSTRCGTLTGNTEIREVARRKAPDPRTGLGEDSAYRGMAHLAASGCTGADSFQARVQTCGARVRAAATRDGAANYGGRRAAATRYCSRCIPPPYLLSAAARSRCANRSWLWPRALSMRVSRGRGRAREPSGFRPGTAPRGAAWPPSGGRSGRMPVRIG